MRLNMNYICQVRDSIAKEIVRIQKTAQGVAQIDVLASLALCGRA